jgi:hypothetical protein
MYINYKKIYYFAWSKWVNTYATKYVYATHEMLHLFTEFIDIFYSVFHPEIHTSSSNGALLTVIQLKAKYISKGKIVPVLN